MNVESGFELDDLLGIARRRAKIALMVAGGFTLVAFWVAMALPNEFESYATVLVEPQAISPELVQAGVRNSDLTERLGLMTAQILARPRLSRIIDEVGLYQEEQESMLREEVIGLMRSRIRVEPVVPELEQENRSRRATEINQFRIFFSSEDPVVAKDVAQRLANDFIERHIEQRVDLSQKGVDFIEAELERVGERIEDVEARVAAVKAANPGRLPENLTANQQRVQRLTTELAVAQRNRAVAESDEAFYRSRVAAAASLGSPNDDASPTRRVELLELALSEYKAKGFTDKHPDVQKTRQEISEIRQRLREEAERPEDDEQDFAASFAEQTAEAEAQRAALRVAAADEEMESLKASLEEIQTLIAETPAVAEQLDGLEREYRHLFGSYQDFSQRRLEATVQAQLERRQLGEQLRVLEPAFQAPEPSSPNRPLIVIVGLLFGLVMGGGLAVVLESTDSSVHSPRQLQSALSLPVLASIPEIWLESDLASLRRKRLRELLAALGVVAFVLVGGVANYAWVNGMPGFLRGAEEEAEAGSVEEPAPAEASGAEG